MVSRSTAFHFLSLANIESFLAIQLLKNKPPGTFLIRDSQGFPGSFGLAVKVETLPTNIQPKPGLQS